VEKVRRLAVELPSPMVTTLITTIERLRSSTAPAIKADVLRTIAHPFYRALASDLLDTWRLSAPDMTTPTAVALALSVALASEQTRREGQTVELVWTGPDTATMPIRHTEQALLQVIDATRQRLILVSYAVYKIPRICNALIRAADRGVSLRLIIETPDRHDYDTLRALGDAVAARSTVYFWPLEERGRDTSGKPGILHVKCAVADSRWLLLSSANLTEYAFTVNMELGILITGGTLPGQVERHFDHLIDSGVLISASGGS
jgi:phosphatidylserine/phosphatidylglycerophosphate/cardiolipin synthase-like enzyme